MTDFREAWALMTARLDELVDELGQAAAGHEQMDEAEAARACRRCMRALKRIAAGEEPGDIHEVTRGKRDAFKWS